MINNDYSKEIIEIIAIKRRLRFYIKKAIRILIAIFVICTLSIIAINYSKIEKIALRIKSQFSINIVDKIFYQKFDINQIEVIGNNLITKEDIINKIISLDLNILNHSSMSTIVNEIQKIPIIKKIYITKSLVKNKIYINIEEKKIIAISYNLDNPKFLSDKNEILDFYPIKEDINSIKKIFGIENAKNFSELYEYLLRKFSILEKIDYIEAYQSGRYDIIFNNNLIIKLPKTKWQDAIDKFVKLDKEFLLTKDENKIKKLDFRIEGKMSIEK